MQGLGQRSRAIEVTEPATGRLSLSVKLTCQYILLQVSKENLIPFICCLLAFNIYRKGGPPPLNPGMKSSIQNSLGLVCLLFLLKSALSRRPTSPFLGISPEDEAYFSSQKILCRDGSKFFPRERLNDGFCDCPDGTDEPGTSSCPESKFYCRNVGSMPIQLFSSRVNDHICDCCDGSDENDGKVICPNTCINNGTIQIKISLDKVQQTELVDLNILEDRLQVNKDDIVHKFEGLKVMILLEVVLLGCIVFCYRQTRYRRRHH